jgi:hypothetical protein
MSSDGGQQRPGPGREDRGRVGAALFAFGLILLLVAIVLVLAQEAPGRVAGIEGAARGVLRGLIRRPFPNPERQVLRTVEHVPARPGSPPEPAR